MGRATDKDVYRKTMSGVSKHDGTPDVYYHVFDRYDVSDTFKARMVLAEKQVLIHGGSHVQSVLHRYVNNHDQLVRFEQDCLSLGFEGVMLRSLGGPYKHGRSTLNEGFLLKLKRFSDAEAVVVGFEELMHNDNEKTTDELGRSKRSSHKDNKHGGDVLGALHLVTPAGIQFSCGSGFTLVERKKLWKQRHRLIGQTVKYKFFAVGVKTAPRFPVFLGFRSGFDA